MHNLIIIFGPQAVGKMTVGKKLADKTGFNFMMNHTTIDVLLPYFDWEEDSFQRLNKLFREEIIREHAKSKKSIIFTFVWDLECSYDTAEMQNYKDIFEEAGGSVYFVELEADFETRLQRNVHPERLEAKPTKRNVAQSTEFLHYGQAHKCNSKDDFIHQGNNFIKIENGNVSPEEVVEQIIERFKWEK